MPRPVRGRACLRWLIGCSAAALALALPAKAQQSPDLPLPRTTFGSVGLIEMPSARLGNDGELSVAASYMKSTQRYNLGFQILPWLEGSFRYSGLQHFNPLYPVYWDRSFGVKARLLEEGDILPAVAIGANDVVGTGIYGGEYLVLSKQFGDVDTTLGIGWGRLGTANSFRNPLSVFSKSFNTRPNQFMQSEAGGSLLKTLFHGSAGVFGGVTWHTPIDRLSLSVEDSSDAYLFEKLAGTFRPHSQINYGLSYLLGGGTSIGLGYLYGDTLSGRISFVLDPVRSQYPVNIGAPVPEPVIRSSEAQRDALRILVGQRDPAWGEGRARAENRNVFVDRLVAMHGIGDVRIAGASLEVSLAGPGNAQALCRSVAATAASADTGFTGVTVKTANGSAAARCAVPRLVQATRHFADFTSGQPLTLSEDRPLLIDATEVQPPVDFRAAERRFRADARKQGLNLLAVRFTDTEATIYYENFHYFHEADAIERLSRLLMADAPPSIEKFRLVDVKTSVPMQEYHVLRSPAERAMAEDQENPSVFNSTVTIQPATMNNPVLRAQSHYPRFDWDVFPQFRQQFFDPSNPVGVQVVTAGEFGAEILPGLLLYGEGELNVFDTFNTGRPSDSVLPHVRTDFVKYFSDGKNGIGALNLSYRTRFAPEVFATFKAGYLESMFSGAGGEVLYRPDGARWAIGADGYEVYQRDFNRLFGLQNYHVFTGHVTLYWASPFYDLDFMARAGQYLAGDRGLTLQVTRRFSTGVEVGAWVTKTNVSSQQFGEGSFDKGIVIRIPLGWIAPVNTQNQINLDLRPVQRDGGQTLAGDATLYGETRQTSEAEILRGGATVTNGW